MRRCLLIILCLALPLSARALPRRTASGGIDAVFAPSVSSPLTSEAAAFNTVLYLGNMTDPYPSENGITASASLSYTLDAVTLLASMCLTFTDRTADFTGQAVYWPLLWHHLNAGAGGVLHFKACGDIFNETDALTGLWTRWRGKYFEICFDACYMLKSSRIHAIDGFVPRLINHSMAVAVEGRWHIPIARLSIFASLSSWDESSFMLFFAPRFQAGIEWQLPQASARNVYLGFSATAVYIDMATLSSYCEGTQLKAYVKWMARGPLR